VDEDALTGGDRSPESLDGALEVEHEARIVQVIEAGPEIELGAVDLAEPARDQQSADRLREVQLGDETGNDRRIRRLRKNPAMPRACSGSRCCHGAKVTTRRPPLQASFARVQKHATPLADLGRASAPGHGAAALQRNHGVAIGAGVSSKRKDGVYSFLRAYPIVSRQ